MISMKKTLVLFDLVGTLTDAGPRYARAFSDTCQEFGYQRPEDKENVIDLLGEKNLKQITEQFVGPLEDAEQQQFMNSCNTQCDALLFSPNWIERLYPNVREVLADLKSQGYDLGIFTGTRKEAAENQLRYHNIKKFFNPAYIQGKDNERDAHLDSENLKIAQLDSIIDAFEGDDVVVIGDSPSDYKAALHHKCRFIGFSNKPDKNQSLAAYGAQVIDDHLKLADTLQSEQIIPRPSYPRPRPPRL